jgi:hypothetical protein
MKALPIGIQDFEKLRSADYLYIDKTALYHNVLKGGTFYFLSRPRRFGKSLMLSTLKYLYQGKKELFKGLWIADNWDWSKTNPVVHLDLNKVNTRTALLTDGLSQLVTEISDEYQIRLQSSDYIGKFRELISRLAELFGKVVILIDEYDKPITDFLLENERAEAHVKDLKAFYSQLKSSDAYIHKVLVTGVSKYGKVAIFSDLNNLFDLTLYDKANEICGYTEAEIRQYFKDHIVAAAEKYKVSEDQLIEWLRNWYNGYSWEGEHKIYNPFSILNFFKTLKFQNFWFDTGTPTLLSELIIQSKYKPQILEYLQTDDIIFNSADLNHIDVLSLLFQTGYLTIKEIAGSPYDPVYILGYPNNEVRISFNSYLLAEYTNSNPTYVGSTYMVEIKNAIKNENWQLFFETLNALFSTVPHHIFGNTEAYFHALTHVVLTMSGNLVLSEVLTNKGRIDAILESDEAVIIFEFKLDKSAEEALKQIEDKDYATRYTKVNKKLIKIGVNFDSEKRQVGEWKLG